MLPFRPRALARREKRIDAGLRVFRDLLSKKDEHDLAMSIDEVICNSNKTTKALVLLALDRLLAHMFTAKEIQEDETADKIREVINEICKL